MSETNVPNNVRQGSETVEYLATKLGDAHEEINTLKSLNEELVKRNEKLRVALRTIKLEEKKYTGKYWTKFIDEALTQDSAKRGG